MKRVLSLNMRGAVDLLKQLDADFLAWQQGQAIHTPSGIAIYHYAVNGLFFRSISGWMMDGIAAVDPEIAKPNDARQLVNWSFYVGDQALRVVWKIGLIPTPAGIAVEVYDHTETIDKPYFDEFNRRLEKLLGSVTPLQQPAQLSVEEKQVKPTIATEEELRKASYGLVADQRTPDWWRELATLFWQYKSVAPKYSYSRLAELIGYSDEKYVGEMMRKYKPPKTT